MCSLYQNNTVVGLENLKQRVACECEHYAAALYPGSVLASSNCVLKCISSVSCGEVIVVMVSSVYLISIAITTSFHMCFIKLCFPAVF